MAGTYDDAVAGYAAHLRAGGTTAWSAWSGEPVVADGGPSPTAPHVELARLLNTHGSPQPGLTALVLSTPVPGRGRVDVPLPWAGSSRAFGHPPTDPAELPADELLRLAVGVLGRLLPHVPDPPPPPDLARWPLPWRRRFRLHGSPGTVAAVRRALLEHGMVETDWRPVHLVLARPVEVMMAEHWAAAAVSGGLVRWATLWHRAESRGSLPGPLDVVRTADRLAAAGRRGESVHLVVARDDAEVAQAVETALGLRRIDVHTTTDPARVDLLRRVNRHSGATLGPAHVTRISRRLAHVLDEGRAPGAVPPPAVPAVAEAWARRAGADLTAQARAAHSHAGYAVHGDAAALDHVGGTHGGVDPGRTLDEALWACSEAWRRREAVR